MLYTLIMIDIALEVNYILYILKIKTALNLQSTFVLTVYERVKTFPKITKYNLASC